MMKCAPVLLVSLCWALILVPTSCEYSIDDSTLFKLTFGSLEDKLKQDASNTINEEGESPAINLPVAPEGTDAKAETEGKEDLRETIVMKTAQGEAYECKLPLSQSTETGDATPYTGKNALEILGQLFTTQSCAYRLEHYWTYELCHGRFIRQYHEEREGKQIKTTEYFLGKYDSETYDKELKKLAEDTEEGNTHKPQKMKIETMNMPFYQLTMRDGTLCDLNGRPRETRVNYVCYPAGKHEMYSFKESSTCEYDVIILSPTLCNHPDYRPEESNEHAIDCRPVDEKSPMKPRKLLELETESLRLRSEKMFEGNFMQGERPGTVKIEIKPVGGAAVGVDDPTDEDVEEEAEAYKEENWPAHAPRQPFKPLMDPEVVKQFLMGEYCLYGGSGWWKYEFCYGKKVDQYHEEKGGVKTVISLGRFDEQRHLNWLKEHPGKRPKPVKSRKHVSHLYSNGDICDMTGRPRHVEVKLKCKQSDSPSAVSLYLLEPKTCEYVLGVESPLVCDIMHLADENGMMNIGKEDLERPRTIVDTPKPPPTKTTPDTIKAAHQAAHEAAVKAATEAAAAHQKATHDAAVKAMAEAEARDALERAKNEAAQKKDSSTASLSKLERQARDEVQKRLEELERTREELERQLDLETIMYDDEDDEDLEDFPYEDGDKQ